MKRLILLLSVFVLSLVIVGCNVQEEEEIEIVDEDGNVVGKASMGFGRIELKNPAEILVALQKGKQCEELKRDCKLLSNYEVVEYTRELQGMGSDGAVCPEGKRILGGGCQCAGSRPGQNMRERECNIVASYPCGDAWCCSYSASARGHRSWAICANTE